MTPAEYRQALDTVAEYLRGRGIDADCRGDGLAQFVYACRGARSVEISWDGIGVFIEMFEGPDETSVRDEQQDTFPIGCERAYAWLSGTI